MLDERFVRPRYGSACFSDVPHAIDHLLTGRRPLSLDPSLLGDLHRPFEHVVCLFIDALGWRFVAPRLEVHPFLKEVTRRGVVSQLTSQFPSTTAVHMTAFHTGLVPARSGIFEWRYFEPTLDAIVCPLPFSFSGERAKETLVAAGADPRAMLPEATFYDTLRDDGVESTVYFPEAFWNSTYSQHVIRGATRRPVKTLAEGLTNVVEQLEAATTPQYINLYHPDIDSICHRYGPGSPQVAAEIDVTLSAVERCLLEPLRGKLKKDTLLLITADHGQVEVSPERTLYLNQDPRLSPLLEMMRTNQAGELLAPAGSPRDMFLYLEPGRVDDAVSLLRPVLEGVADVAVTADLVADGYFGDTSPCEAFGARIADVVILPYQHEAVWWFEEGRFANTFYGHHGGLTPEEMLIPLMAYPLG